MGILDVVREAAPDLWDRLERREALGDEHRLELTTPPGSQPYAPWTDAHLDIADSTLGRLPAEHLAPLERIQLGGLETRAAGEYRPGHRGLVKLSADVAPSGPDRRHDGCTSALAGHDDRISGLEMTLAHEIGHLVENEVNPDAAARIVAAAGWQESGGQWSEMVRSSDQFVPTDGVRCGADGAPMSPDQPYSSWDSWDYARSGADDYFAEMYTKSVNVPETLHADLIEGPARQIAIAELAGLPTADVERLRQAAAQKQLQWDIMRGEIFGVTDELVADRIGDLEALGQWSDDKEMDATIRSFEREAARAMTPDQLDRLLDRYLAA
jgi:hypothetical protein